MQKIIDPAVVATLNRLHQASSKEFPTILKGLTKGVFRKLRPEDMKDAYIAISRSQGEFIYDLLLQRKAKNIVEFGTSFGISTIYLGAAAKATGGHVITSELLPEKCAVARQNFKDAGLEQFIEVREGDALQTLKNVPEPIDFLLLDGWNDLYLPLLRILEPKFKNGTLIYTDNASFRSAQPFIQYIHSNSDKYQSKRIKDAKGGSELTEYVALPTTAFA